MMSEEKKGEADRLSLPESAPVCPYCQRYMSAMKTPPMTNWESPFLWVCFNDECVYFQRGWEWMASQFNTKSSYRFKIDPITGEQGPLPVWSPNAMKSEIIEIKKEETGE